VRKFFFFFESKFVVQELLWKKHQFVLTAIAVCSRIQYF
jgi:hypothetical protein